METYWLPLSLWCTSLLPARPADHGEPVPERPRTKLACAVRLTRQPTIRRGIGVDDKGDIDEAGPGRDVGVVG